MPVPIVFCQGLSRCDQELQRLVSVFLIPQIMNHRGSTKHRDRIRASITGPFTVSGARGLYVCTNQTERSRPEGHSLVPGQRTLLSGL